MVSDPLSSKIIQGFFGHKGRWERSGLKAFSLLWIMHIFLWFSKGGKGIAKWFLYQAQIWNTIALMDSPLSRSCLLAIDPVRFFSNESFYKQGKWRSTRKTSSCIKLGVSKCHGKNQPYLATLFLEELTHSQKRRVIFSSRGKFF